MNNRPPSLRLALLDPSYRTPDLSSWPWAAAELSRPLLDQIYYKWLAESALTKLDLLSGAKFWGGVVCVDEQTICWFRFLEGGRDTLGRPGRIVLLCALGTRNEYAGSSGILVGQDFASVAASARTSIPVPAPPTLYISQEELVSATRDAGETKYGRRKLEHALAELNTLVRDTPVDKRVMYIIHLTTADDYCITRFESPRLERSMDQLPPPEKDEHRAAGPTQSNQPAAQHTIRVTPLLLVILCVPIALTGVLLIGLERKRSPSSNNGHSPEPTTTQSTPQSRPREFQKSRGVSPSGKPWTLPQ